MDKLRTIEVFIEVAKQHGFAMAADKLGISAPAVTRSIADLENRLGTSLFHRTTRHVKLTQSGARFLQDATRIVEDLAEAEDAVKGIYTKPSGVLTVTAPVVFGEKHVMPIITEYLGLHPDVSVKAMLYDRVTSLVEEELDVAIRIGHLKDSDLYATHVGQVSKVFCGSPAYFKKYGIPNVPSDLLNHSIVFPISTGNATQWTFNNQGKRETLKLKPRLRCNQIAASLNAAILGHGITSLMTYQVGDAIESGKLQRVLTEYEEPPIPVNVIHVEGRRANAKIRSFIDLAVKRLRSNYFINPVG